MTLKKIVSPQKWLFVISIFLSCCRATTTPITDSVEMFSKKLANIFVVGTLIVEYHKKNNCWPESTAGLEQFYDSARVVVVNFDSLVFLRERNILTVNYRFVKDPSYPATITFVSRENTTLDKSQPEWCHEVFDKSNTIFEGQLVFKYDKGYFTCL
ncbi:MAG: hypothetical protein WKF87_08740 [Chryseolinea sp.]